MLYPTHIVGGLIAGILLTQSYGSIEESLPVLLTTAIASLLPDLDSPQSRIGSRMPFFSWLINSVFGHRGFLHSLLGCAMWIVLIFFGLKIMGLVVYQGAILNAFFIGYIVHLSMDMLTPNGLPLLWPWKARMRLPIARTGGPLEKCVILPILSGYLLFQLINYSIL